MLTKVLIVLFFLAGVSTRCQKCFPKDFLFGVATSSYQIEGAWNTSGKGTNIWDDYTHSHPELILDGSNGDVACDSYNKYNEDIELLEDLGVSFYRLSLSWARILPDGTLLNVNQDGVDYYLNVLKALKTKKIEPVVTLYHWDLPLNLHHLGGWNNPLIVDYFGVYAKLCYQLFGAYVKYWATLNEPQTQCLAGYGFGSHAPGIKSPGIGVYLCAYTQIKAHARAYHIYKDEFKATQHGDVGIVLVSHWFQPQNNTADHLEAQNYALEFLMGLFANPIYKGNWPQVVIDRVGNLSEIQGFARSRLPSFTEEEIEYINGTYDYFGFNYYTTNIVFPLGNITEPVSYAIDRNVGSTVNSTWPQAKSSWLYDVPEGIRSLLKWIKDKYNNPKILITENGWSDDGSSLNDSSRIQYLEGHLCNILKAKYLDGVDVIGYTEWSLMDNFEWGSGYTEKFGIVSVNFSDSNLTRTPKNSYYWYKNVIKTRCLKTCDLETATYKTNYKKN